MVVPKCLFCGPSRLSSVNRFDLVIVAIISCFFIWFFVLLFISYVCTLRYDLIWGVGSVYIIGSGESNIARSLCLLFCAFLSCRTSYRVNNMSSASQSEYRSVCWFFSSHLITCSFLACVSSVLFSHALSSFVLCVQNYCLVILSCSSFSVSSLSHSPCSCLCVLRSVKEVWGQLRTWNIFFFIVYVIIYC